MTLISILLPVKNQENFISETLESIFAQTYDSIELIVINDGSTDITGEILESYRQKFHFKLIHFTESKGIVHALNSAIALSEGAYIARMDGDDIMHPQRIEKQLNFMEKNPNIDLCGCQVECFTSGELSSGVKIFENWSNTLLTHEQMFSNLYMDSPVVHPTFFARRSLYSKIGTYNHTEYAEDYDFLFRCFYSGITLGKVPEVLLRWRDHSGRETRTNKNFSKYNLFYQKASFFKKFDKRAELPIYVFGAGRFSRAVIESLEKENIPILGIVDPTEKKINSLLRGYRVHSLYSEFPDNALFVVSLSYSGPATDEVRKFVKQKHVLYWAL